MILQVGILFLPTSNCLLQKSPKSPEFELGTSEKPFSSLQNKLRNYEDERVKINSKL